MSDKDEYNSKLQGFVRSGQYLPGAGSDKDRVRFVRLSLSLRPKETYQKVLAQISPPIASHGGVVLEPVVVTTPTGIAFFPLTCSGDVLGWIRQIELGAGILGCLTARMDGELLIVSNGEMHPITSCTVEFGR